MLGVTRSDCAARDAADPLGHLRDQFHLPPGVIYLDGNSLGPLPRRAATRVRDALQLEWGDGLIRGWVEANWWDKPVTLGARLAPLIGAGPDEVLVGDSTSINTFKVAVAALRLRPDRRVIVTDRNNFPTDLYMIGSAAELCGQLEVRVVDDPEGVVGALDGSVAFTELTHVDYRTARLYPMAEVTQATHDAGALAIWDLAHSVGAVPLALDACDVDFAVGCTYKYLNGGPGAPAFLFAASRLHDALRQPLVGWHGHARPFGFEPAYEAAAGMRQFACGSPPIVSFAALEGSLEVWEHVDLDALFAKGRALSELLIECVEPSFVPGEFELASPRDPLQRGSHVALRHRAARSLVVALEERGVLGDFREPDIVRLGIAPLYLRFVDIWDAADALRSLLAAGVVDSPA
ncbi:MAG: kynureninase [Acidimicrobiales bacterium]